MTHTKFSISSRTRGLVTATFWDWLKHPFFHSYTIGAVSYHCTVFAQRQLMKGFADHSDNIYTSDLNGNIPVTMSSATIHVIEWPFWDGMNKQPWWFLLLTVFVKLDLFTGDRMLSFSLVYCEWWKWLIQRLLNIWRWDTERVVTVMLPQTVDLKFIHNCSWLLLHLYLELLTSDQIPPDGWEYLVWMGPNPENPLQMSTLNLSSVIVGFSQFKAFTTVLFELVFVLCFWLSKK